MTDAQKIAKATELQRAGRLDEAERLYRQVLATNPNHVQALHNWGIALSATGQTEKAIAAFQQAIALKPDYASAFFNLAIALQAATRTDDAITALRRAVELRPNHLPSHLNLAQALLARGITTEAVNCLRCAVNLQPTSADLHNQLGAALKLDNQLAAALASLQKAVALDPHSAEAHYNLGVALAADNQLETAANAYQKAIALRPDYPEAHNNLGAVLTQLQQVPQAIAVLTQAIQQWPDYVDFHNNLGAALIESDQAEKAVAIFRHAIDLRPELPHAHTYLGVTLLSMGEFAEAWPQYEWRLKMDQKNVVKPTTYPQPLWNGEPLDGKTILLHPEQGFGDVLLFLRFIPLVAHHGGRCILEIQPELVRLLQHMPHIHAVVERGKPLPPFDVQCPLLSLPRIFNTSLQTLPTTVPYIPTDSALLQKWRERLGPRKENHMRVGLVWSGRPFPPGRSVPWQELAPLASIPNIQFHSLQFGEAAKEPSTIPNGIHPIDWSTHLTDFAETAALMSALDLIITIDSATANLAGALGRPTWVLLRHAPDWRWMLHEPTTPWFPTALLFRQKVPRQWTDVVQQVAKELREAAEKFKPD